MNSTNEKKFDCNDFKHKPFPDLKKPRICGYYSIGKEREFKPDASNLLYLYGNLPSSTKQVNFDLNQGYHKAKKKPEFLKEIEKLNNMLEYLKQNSRAHLSTDSSRLFDCDFICFRGLFTVISCTPYEKNEGWSICASYFKGNIYLYDRITDQKRESILNANEKQKRCAAWGYKFEQYILTDDPNKPPNTSEPVHEAEEFCCIYETKLNGIRILYGAEMDGLLSSKKVDLSTVNLSKLKFIELKTNRQIENDRQRQNFVRFKLLKWWCQCFMANINDIVVGFRNDHGRVFQLKHLKVNEMPKKTEDMWHPTVCINFLYELLAFIKEIIVNDESLADVDPYTVWKFEWNPPGLHINCEKIIGHSEYTFIPDWYVENFGYGK